MSNKSYVYNSDYVNTSIQSQFFGEKLNIARNDTLKYPIFEKLYNTQTSFFWSPEEVELSKDLIDWRKLEPKYQRIFELNLQYQTLLDSVQERSVGIALLPYVSLPELEQIILAWGFFEQIHSKSYQYILKNLYINPSPIFDGVITDEEIKKRAASVVKYYDDFIEYAQLFSRYGYGTVTINANNITTTYVITEYELCKRLYMCLVNIYILESVRFYVSFSCSFYFAQHMGILKGNASIISMIARDEKLHTAISLNLINNFKRSENNAVMLEVIKDCEPLVVELFERTMNEELDWIEYLFRDCELPGYTKQEAINYLQYLTGNRMRNLGIANKYESVKHPIMWVEDWLNPKNKQVAPQEQELTDSYLVGAVSMKNYQHIKYLELVERYFPQWN